MLAPITRYSRTQSNQHRANFATARQLHATALNCARVWCWHYSVLPNNMNEATDGYESSPHSRSSPTVSPNTTCWIPSTSETLTRRPLALARRCRRSERRRHTPHRPTHPHPSHVGRCLRRPNPMRIGRTRCSQTRTRPRHNWVTVTGRRRARGRAAACSAAGDTRTEST